VKKIFGIVQVHLDFFEDHLAFFLHVFGIEFRPQHKVGDDVKGDGEVLIKNFCVEADLFFGSESVKHAADGIHFARDGFGGASLRALKTMCSMKWARPFSSGTSRREPLRTHTPTETERTWGMVSVMTTRPLGKTCF